MDSATQQRVIDNFWSDKQQQDMIWRTILWTTGTLLLILLSSLWYSPFYSPLHAAFTAQLSAQFGPSYPAAPRLTVALLVLSVVVSSRLSMLFETSRAPSIAPFHSSLFLACSLMQLPVLFIPLIARLRLSSFSVYGCIPFGLTVLYWMLCVHALRNSRMLSAEIRKLSKLRYSLHTA